MAAAEQKTVVTCLSWVKKGCAKAKPDKVTLEKEELQRIIESTEEKLQEEESLDESDDAIEEDVTEALKKAQSVALDISHGKSHDKKKRSHDDDDDDDDDKNIIDEYGLDDYDNDESDRDPFQGLGDLTPFASNDDDPYVTLKNDVDSDDEDFILKPTDNLLAVGKLTDDAALLEIHVYNGELNNLFVHHDYILPTFPLALEWLDYDITDGSKGNFVALGTMEPDIGLWDLDIVDSLEPAFTLEGCKKRKKKMKKKEVLSHGHSDAVLDLSWNTNVRNVLGSASADTTIRLWDLSEGKSVSTLKHHSKQVQCITWHPVESQMLLSGSFDESLAVIDCRSPEEDVKTWHVQGEVERTLWNHFAPFQFLASTDQGMLYCVDIRQEKPFFTLSAHDKAVTGMSLSSQIPGLLITASPDKRLKVWDIQDDKPSMVLSRNMHMDTLHCTACNPDHPFTFAIGADKDFKVWDIRESATVRQHFLSRMPATLAAECEGDEDDLPDEEAVQGMASLKMEDDKDAMEVAEVLAAGGKRPTMSANEAFGKKKKKKKKKTSGKSK